MGTKTVRHQCCGRTFVVSPQLGGLFFNLFLQTSVIAIVGARLYAFILAFLRLCIAFPLAYRVLLLLLFFLFDFAVLHVHMKCEKVLSSKLKNEFENYSFSSPFLSFLSFPFHFPFPFHSLTLHSIVFHGLQEKFTQHYWRVSYQQRCLDLLQRFVQHSPTRVFCRHVKTPSGRQRPLALLWRRQRTLRMTENVPQPHFSRQTQNILN